MKANDELTQFSCTVFRDGTSYLFFQSFRMEIYGARLEDSTVLVISMATLFTRLSNIYALLLLSEERAIGYTDE